MNRICLGIAVSAAWIAAASAQSADANKLLNPPADAWLTYHGAYNGQRHSALRQIAPENIERLEKVWTFQTGQNAPIKASPILMDGVLYITTPDNLWAIDARTGKQRWHYQHPMNNAFHIGHRGAAVYKDTVYLTTPDCHLIAFHAKSGKIKWNVVIADSNKGYWSTNAPLVVKNHVLVGVSGDFDNVPGQLKSIDADTGKTQWIFYSTPPGGGPESESGGATGGQMWTTGTYDPELNLVSPHDTHDWDANEVPVLADAEFGGRPRKLLMQASRNGYFFVLDRTVGKNLLTAPFAAVNWTKGIDSSGRPIPDPAKEPAKDGVLVAPNEAGATNFRPPSFDPKTGLFIVSAQDGYGIYFFKAEHGGYGWAGADYNVAGKSFLRAIDYRTGRIAWEHGIGDGAGTAGVLTTDSGLTISGDNRTSVLALRTSDGATLWHADVGRVQNAPVTYALDGKQYLIVAGGSSLHAFALPDSKHGVD